jgi:hypothetical protein
VLQEEPGSRSLVGGAIILFALFMNIVWSLRRKS